MMGKRLRSLPMVAGNKSWNKSSDTIPTSPFTCSSRTKRAKTAGLSWRRRLCFRRPCIGVCLIGAAMLLYAGYMFLCCLGIWSAVCQLSHVPAASILQQQSRLVATAIRAEIEAMSNVAMGDGTVIVKRVQRREEYKIYKTQCLLGVFARAVPRLSRVGN